MGRDWPEGEISAGYSMWAFRDAVANAPGKYYQNAVYADNYYKRVVSEIEDAYRDGRLKKASSINVPLFTSIHRDNFYPMIKAVEKSTRKVNNFFDDTVVPGYNQSIDNGHREDYQLLQKVTGQKAVVDSERIALKVTVLQRLAAFYAKINKILLIFATLFYIFILCRKFCLFQGSKNYNGFFAIMSMIGFSFFLRIFTIAYNDVTAFSSINYMYLSPCFPLMAAFISCGTVGLIKTCRERKKNER